MCVCACVCIHACVCVCKKEYSFVSCTDQVLKVAVQHIVLSYTFKRVKKPRSEFTLLR